MFFANYNFKTGKFVESADDYDYHQGGGLLTIRDGCPKKFVIKMQLPLSTSLDGPLILVYNRKRTIFGTIPLTPELIKLFNGQPKIYYRGHIEDNQLVLDGSTAPEHW
jgi:hypothetical protein